MALTNTKKAKEFMAGAPDLKLKGDLRPKQDMQMASMDENEREFMRLVEEFMERGFSQQEAIEEARETLEKKSMAEGGIMQTVPRQGYFLGKIVKGIKSAVKGVTKTVKKNPLLALAALNFAPMLAPGGKPFFGLGLTEGKFGNPLSLLNLTGDKTGTGAAMDALKIAGVGGTVTGLLSSMTQQEGESNQEFGARKARVRDQLDVQFRRLYPQGGNESDEDYNIRINALIEGADDSKFSDGGRVMRAFGSDELVEQASGIEGIPINVNSKGVKELDLRETGGFIPPVGVKEKADDIPAMLSNNEFVMTADAVRAAGGGSVNKGAQRMYDLMKNLESKVV